MDISSTDSKPKKIKNCTLDKTTQGLIKLIFDNDMFNNAMKNFDIGEWLSVVTPLYGMFMSL